MSLRGQVGPRNRDPVRCAEYAPVIFHNLCEDELTHMVSNEYYRFLTDPTSCPAVAQQGTRKLVIDGRVRSIMIDWLHKVWCKFKLKPEVMYHTVSLLDRYCDARLAMGEPVTREQYQLTGCTCMWISSKYNEIYAPEMNDFVKIASTPKVINSKTLPAEETAILQALDFELTVPSLHTFTQRLLQVIEPYLVGEERHKERSKFVAMYFIECSLHDHLVLAYPPSQIAATAVYLGIIMTKTGEWNEDLENVSGYSQHDFGELTRTLRAYILNPKPLFRSVREKYAKPEFGGVSNLVTSKSSKAGGRR